MYYNIIAVGYRIAIELIKLVEGVGLCLAPDTPQPLLIIIITPVADIVTIIYYTIIGRYSYL